MNIIFQVIVFSWQPLLYGRTKASPGTRARFEPQILDRKSLQLLLLELRKKHDAQVVKTCIFNNPLFDIKIVAYFGQKSESNLNECRFPY